MTSKQIKSQTKGGQAFWLRELAFQFARLNERNAEMDEYNAKADAEEAEAKVKSQGELSNMIRKGTATLERLGGPVYPDYVPAPPAGKN